MQNHSTNICKFKRFMPTNEPTSEKLMADAKAARERCLVTKFEALFIRAWHATSGKGLEKRKSIVQKQLAKIQQQQLNPGLVQPALWRAASEATRAG